MGFSKYELNVTTWNGNSNLTLGADAAAYGVRLTGNPNANSRILFLNATQQNSKVDNVEYPFTLTIYDPFGFIDPGSPNYSGAGLRIQPASTDTSPTPEINGSTTQQQFTSVTGKLICEFIGTNSGTGNTANAHWVIYDPITRTTSAQGAQGTAGNEFDIKQNGSAFQTGPIGVLDFQGSNFSLTTSGTSASGATIGIQVTSGSMSGTTNFVPKFTSATAIGNSEITDTGTVVKIGSDSSGNETLYLDTDNRKVGFRTNSPGAAFDVNGTIRVRNQLNVGHTTEQNLYVDGNGSAGGKYVKMGNYGVPGNAAPDNGNYFGITGSENQPKYCIAAGDGGKLVQDMRIITVSVSGNAFKNLLSTGTTIIPNPGEGILIVPYECVIRNSGGTAGSWLTTDTAGIGFCETSTCTYPAQFIKMFQINNTLLRTTNQAWNMISGVITTGKAIPAAKALILKASNNLTGGKDFVPAGTWYIQIRYQLINLTAGLVNNVDIAKTTN